MQVEMIGTSHIEAPLSYREHFSAFLKECAKELSVEEIPHVLVLTCNRAELYFSSNGLQLQLPEPEKGYHYYGVDCFQHLSAVASGLKSAELFETDIVRQVKRSYANATEQGDLSTCLHFLFQKSLQIAKQVRSSSYFGNFSTSLTKTIYELIEPLFNQYPLQTLFVGNSAVNRRLIHSLRNKREMEIFLCTKTTGLPLALQQTFVQVVPWEQLESWRHFDVVICASEANHYLLNKPTGARLLIDLAVPRNINPELSETASLFNIEDLNGLMEQKRESYKETTDYCEQLIQAQVEKKMLGRKQLLQLSFA